MGHLQTKKSELNRDAQDAWNLANRIEDAIAMFQKHATASTKRKCGDVVERVEDLVQSIYAAARDLQ